MAGFDCPLPPPPSAHIYLNMIDYLKAMLFQALLDLTGRHTIKFKETMTTFHKIFLLIVKERKHSKFHQVSLKRCGLHAVVFRHT